MVIGGYWFGLINCLAYKIGFNKLSPWLTYFRKSCRHLNYRREYFTMTNTILINKIWSRYVYLVAQSCLTLCNPMNHSLPAFSVHGISKARILEGLPLPSPGFLIKGSNPGLLHFRQILYHLSHQGSPESDQEGFLIFSSKDHWFTKPPIWLNFWKC